MEIYWRLAPALGVMMRLMAPLVMTGTYHWPQLKYFQYLTGGNGGFTRSSVMRLYERDMQAIRMGYRVDRSRVGRGIKDPKSPEQ